MDLIQMENVAHYTLSKFDQLNGIWWKSSLIRYCKRMAYHFTLYSSFIRAFQFSFIYEWNMDNT